MWSRPAPSPTARRSVPEWPPSRLTWLRPRAHGGHDPGSVGRRRGGLGEPGLGAAGKPVRRRDHLQDRVHLRMTRSRNSRTVYLRWTAWSMRLSGRRVARAASGPPHRSILSSASTTTWDTAWATSCCARWRAACGPASAPRTRWPLRRRRIGGGPRGGRAHGARRPHRQREFSRPSRSPFARWQGADRRRQHRDQSLPGGRRDPRGSDPRRIPRCTGRRRWAGAATRSTPPR